MRSFTRILPAAVTGRRRHLGTAEREEPGLGHRLALEDLESLRNQLSGPAAAPGPAAQELLSEAADACDEAERLLGRASGHGAPSTVATATAVLARAWQAIAIAAAGEEVPRLPVCFFDPRHGMASSESRWTTVRHGTRAVPVCRADDERLENGIAPDARTVDLDGRPVRYFEAGEQVREYLEGYFPSASLEWVRTSGWTGARSPVDYHLRAAHSAPSEAPNAGAAGGLNYTPPPGVERPRSGDG